MARGEQDALCAIVSPPSLQLGRLAINVCICNGQRSSEISCDKYSWCCVSSESNSISLSLEWRAGTWPGDVAATARVSLHIYNPGERMSQVFLNPWELSSTGPYLIYSDQNNRSGLMAYPEPRGRTLWMTHDLRCVKNVKVMTMMMIIINFSWRMTFQTPANCVQVKLNFVFCSSRQIGCFKVTAKRYSTNSGAQASEDVSKLAA
jgi:hypothetical protein